MISKNTIPKIYASFPDIWACNQDEKGITATIKIKRLRITFGWRSKKNLWGRFGGGWNWKLGFQSSGKTVIFSLLICEIDFRWRKRDTVQNKTL